MKPSGMGLHINSLPSSAFLKYQTSVFTVKAPNIAHLRLLTSVGYNRKETKLKKCEQPNKVFIMCYLHRVQNEKYFPDL